MSVSASVGSRAAVFLDRDGVLNEVVVRSGRPYPPATLADFVLLPGVVEACQELRSLGFALVVVTNQPDIARKRQEACVVAAMHAHLTSAIHLDAVYVCPHDDDDRCECRKPAPGMLIAASSDLDLDLARSFMVGDRWRDIEAGKRAGCRTIHIDYGYDEEGPEAPDAIVVDLPSAVSWIKSVSADTKESRSA